MDIVNLAEKLASFTDTWSPRIVGEVNGQHVKVARLDGDFVWHHHAEGDELFLVLKGSLRLCLPDREVRLEEGELFIVPRGMEHRPVTDEECWVLLFERAGTLNTGQVRGDRTGEDPERI